MSKEVVLFRSKTGYTFRYAKWISEALHCDLIENRKLDIKEIKTYDTIIIGGGIYAGTVNGLDFLGKNWDSLWNKNIVIFAVGSAEGDAGRIEQLWNRQLTSEQRQHAKCYYLRGGFDFSKLSSMDKFLMRIFKVMIKRKKEQTEETKGLLAAFKNPVDFTSETKIIPIVDSVEKMRKQKKMVH